MSDKNNDFLAEDLDDEKTVSYIKSYLPQELKDRFTDDELYYFVDLIDEFYTTSGVLDQQPDEEGYIDLDLDRVVDYIIAQAKRDEVGEYNHDEILFVVQGEMDYTDQLG